MNQGPPVSPGELPDRIETLRTLVKQAGDEADPKLLEEFGGQLFQAREFEEAAGIYQRLTASDEGTARFHNNLAACQLELGRYHEAIASATAAIERDPKLGAALANRADAYRQLGQVKLASEDYETAVALDPRNPVLLNKAGACAQLYNRYRLAGELFRKALAVAPSYNLARLNLGLLELEITGSDSALEQIRSALRDPSLDPQSRTVGDVALAVTTEHKRLRQPLDKAVEARDPALLDEVIDSTPPSLLRTDRPSVKVMESVAESCRALNWEPEAFRLLGDTSSIPFLEACVHCKLESRAESLHIVRQSLEKGGPLPPAAQRRNLPAIVAACEERRQQDFDGQFAARAESLLHYWHARLTAHNRHAWPGQYKPVPNAIGTAELVPAAPPAAVAGTVRHMAREIAPDLEPGLPRAVFLLATIIQIHAFKDGNGRLARFVFSGHMESAGLGPLMVTPVTRHHYVEGLQQGRAERSAQPLVDGLVRVYRDAQQLLNEYNRHQGPKL
ncbi:MAG: tetratricopeptide repeat protein [Xanthomonadales bacterium]|nr:tetratricopeptide repeat protein [Xanthomonadales bacterium]